MPPFTLRHIDHIVLRVRDLERSVAFYRDVFGADIAKRRDDLGMVHLRAGSAMIDLVDIDGQLGRAGGAPAQREGRNVDHFCLRIDPFDEAAIIAHLERFGLAPGKAVIRFGAEGNGPSIYCFDPDGNQVELKGPAEPAGG